MIRYVTEWLTGLLPGQCMVCGNAAPHAVCPPCAKRFWSHDAALPRCESCGIRLFSGAARFDPARPGPRAAEDLCGCCMIERPAFDATIALADYRPPLDGLAIAFKFRGRPALAAMLAERLAAHALARFHAPPNEQAATAQAPKVRGRPDLLLPVPLSPRRLAMRGYNQAWELTRRVARRTAIPAHATLLMRTHSAAQSELGLASRQLNMRASVRANPRHAHLLRGRHVAVVDDVMTTGATLDAAARALKAAGATRVTNLVLFRTA